MFMISAETDWFMNSSQGGPGVFEGFFFDCRGIRYFSETNKSHRNRAESDLIIPKAETPDSREIQRTFSTNPPFAVRSDVLDYHVVEFGFRSIEQTSAWKSPSSLQANSYKSVVYVIRRSVSSRHRTRQRCGHRVIVIVVRFYFSLVDDLMIQSMF